ncbi:hypothetical protein [Eleftheria terrae]|uniref:hypothetical protein n=1 Tax=Eleftheria terrae TaxID=1597781 RepID=UPI00263B2566|nr:hypothetical protein [Eleftheria terrae]WKB50556.1 hypothetical protein N7L95_00110 [Eleftheria terrae]
MLSIASQQKSRRLSRGVEVLELFPETQERQEPVRFKWCGGVKDTWGHPRVEVHLMGLWFCTEGWRVGWMVRLDKALDEWYPGDPHRHAKYRDYPWYRLETMPTSTQLVLASAAAARAAKIVLAQMTAYSVDQAGVDDANRLSMEIEDQARRWLLT